MIFVDDLDRLVPSKAVELLEVLKLFLDCKQCVFVLAIDYEVVIRGAIKKYGFASYNSEKSMKKNAIESMKRVSLSLTRSFRCHLKYQ